MPQLTIDQAMQIAVQHHQAGRLQEAERLYRQILLQQPVHSTAIHNIGLIARQAGRNDIAVELLRRAIALNPNYAEAYYNLGNALRDMGQLDGAIAAYRQVIALKPKLADAHNNLGVALHANGQLDEAITVCLRAIALNPNLADAHNNLGNALRDKGQLGEAIAAHCRGISLNPDLPDSHNNLGVALRDAGQVDPAISACRRASALKPDYAEAYSNLGNALTDKGHLDEAISSYRRAIALRPNYAEAHSNLLLTIQYHAAFDARAIAQEHRRWNEQHAQPLAKWIHPHGNAPVPDRRLKIGYVSGDFKTHSMSRFLLPVIECHDPARVEVFCYSDVRCPDEMTSRFREHAHVWRDIAGLCDEGAAERIREDAIDILVDLAMHTARNRLLMFARKPAPVQMTWLACPGGTGVETVDYRITDHFLDPFDSAQGQGPTGVDDSLYAEQSVRLPDCWCCYRPRLETPAVNDLPAQAIGHVTFGCLNNFCKVSREALRCWAQLLREFSNSRLMLHAHEGSHRQDVRALLTAEGVDADRLVFVGRLPVSEYLRLYHQIDICLDPFPYAGGTTSCDALYMGVPVVSLSGRTAAGRGTATLLHNIGLPELVAESTETYIRIATELALDLPRVNQMRSTLRRRMQASPLMDEVRFTRNVEAAYRQVWRKWCASGGSTVT